MPRAKPIPVRELRRFTVFASDDGFCTKPERRGDVLLYDGASPSEVEHACIAVGVFAPRGLDTLTWNQPYGATVRDASGAQIVRILPTEYTRKP